MKAVFCLLILFASVNLARAGFAGPPPFTNDSPLQSGTDGIYQAIASGTNLTGVFSFVISNGIQTSTQTRTINSWVFFVDGNIVQGSVTAAISRGRLAGVLNAGASNLLTNDDGSVTLPAAFVVPGNAASGEFSGSFQYNSSLGIFEGKGSLEGAPPRTDQLVFIDEPQAAVISNGTVVTPATTPVTVTPITIEGSTFDRTRFRFNGTRVFTGTPPATVTATPPPAADTNDTTATGTTGTGTTTISTSQ